MTFLQLFVVTWMIQTMVKWSSLTPQLDQQPTTSAIRATFSAMKTAPALVKLMDSGLGAHPLVNVSEYINYGNLYSKPVNNDKVIKFLVSLTVWNSQPCG